AMKIAEETFAGTAEREGGHRSGDPNVHTNISDVSLTSEFTRAGAVAGKDASHVPVRSPVHQVDRRIDALRMDHAQNRSENFCMRDLAIRLKRIQHRRADEIASFAAVDFCATAVDQRFGAFTNRFANEALDARFAFRRDHRAHLDAFIQPIPNDPSFGSLANGGAEKIPPLANPNHRAT